MADVSGDLLRRSTETTDGVSDDQVNLAGVRLGRNVVATREAGLFTKQFVQLVTLGSVTVEDLEERCLRSSGSLGTWNTLSLHTLRNTGFGSPRSSNPFRACSILSRSKTRSWAH